MEKIYKNSKVPGIASVFINVYAITLWPFIFIKDDGHAQVLNHERIHLRQQAELLILGFYFLYVLFWIINLVRFRSFSEAYHRIPFEMEAYDNEANLKYLEERKKYFWLDYMKPQ